MQEQRRGLPDVAANADPETGYRILVDGQEEVVGGTSAPASLWAGLIVVLNQKLNRHLGFVNPEIYNLQRKGGFREITIGNNGAFTAGHGWNPCTGQGAPQGTALLQAPLKRRTPVNPFENEMLPFPLKESSLIPNGLREGLPRGARGGLVHVLLRLMRSLDTGALCANVPIESVPNVLRRRFRIQKAGIWTQPLARATCPSFKDCLFFPDQLSLLRHA